MSLQIQITQLASKVGDLEEALGALIERIDDNHRSCPPSLLDDADRFRPLLATRSVSETDGDLLREATANADARGESYLIVPKIPVDEAAQALVEEILAANTPEATSKRALQRPSEARPSLAYVARIAIDGGPSFSIPCLVPEPEARAMFEAIHAHTPMRASIEFETVASVPRPVDAPLRCEECNAEGGPNGVLLSQFLTDTRWRCYDPKAYLKRMTSPLAQRPAEPLQHDWRDPGYLPEDRPRPNDSERLVTLFRAHGLWDAIERGEDLDVVIARHIEGLRPRPNEAALGVDDHAIAGMLEYLVRVIENEIPPPEFVHEAERKAAYYLAQNVREAKKRAKWLRERAEGARPETPLLDAMRDRVDVLEEVLCEMVALVSNHVPPGQCSDAELDTLAHVDALLKDAVTETGSEVSR